MLARYSPKYLLFFLMYLGASLNSENCDAQTKIVLGRVYAFKNLGLNHIEIKSKKTKAVTYSDWKGEFALTCSPNDKLIFRGEGFERTTKKIDGNDSVSVKLIFIDNRRQFNSAIEHEHVTHFQLTHALENYDLYNTAIYWNKKNPFRRRTYLKRELKLMNEYNEISSFHQYTHSPVQIIRSGLYN